MRFIYAVVNLFYSLGLVRTANRLARIGKLSLGLYRSSFTKNEAYSKSWWDESFYGSSVLDKNTISNSIDEYSTAYHYASVELILAKEFFHLKDVIKLETILDLGTGAGHWIDFYRRLGADTVYGLDVSEKAINNLRKKYAEPKVRLINGTINTFQKEQCIEIDLVNAIGVMFHIVDDAEWRDSLAIIHKILKKGGVLVVGGHFGVIDGLNVQIDENGINKRLRSARNWKKTLKKIGFKDVKFVKNSAAYNIKRTLPENNVLIATKE